MGIHLLGFLGLQLIAAQSFSTGKPHCSTFYVPGAPLSNPTCQECVPFPTPPPGRPVVDLPVCSYVIQPSPSPAPSPSIQFVFITPVQQSAQAVQSHQESSVNAGMVVGITLGCIVFVVVLCGLFLYARRSSQTIQKKPSIVIVRSVGTNVSSLPMYAEGMNIGEYDSAVQPDTGISDSFQMPTDL